MDKTYEPKNFEGRLYKFWEENGYFKPEANENGKPYTIVMPPPNITGQLHMGHALGDSIQDCLIRYKRMKGYAALWLPGTDHASIATELKIAEALKQEGIDKRSLGREGFLKRAWDWKNQYASMILEQLKRLGSSCDFSRLTFTMDEERSRAVKHVFVKMYNDGLIYRGDRIINVCTQCGTALSDAELEYEEKASKLWFFKYYTLDGAESLTFATTRPETMLGDVALAVNPSDERYKHLVGKTVRVPFVNREIPVIADYYVEKDFGSGVVKITPCHDPNDFEVGERNGIKGIKIMTERGIINENGGEFNGLDRFDARKKIVAEMEKIGQLVKIENYTHSVGCCYRCNTIVEPISSKQWFVKMPPLAKPAVDAVVDGRVTYVPQYFEKGYLHWMNNIRDWCISRQLWWGHRIPVYYCDCSEIVCAENEPSSCPKCGGAMRQDEDVLDTWFSSALWPFSTLGYPEKTPDLERFFPNDVLVTAYDIIPFWVARMIFSSLEHMGKAPFKHVLIHGLIRDAEGRKMSKSLNNGIDPLKLIEECGADALRFSLLNGVSNGTDIRFSEDKVTPCRNFMNKVYNAARFVLMNCEGKTIPPLDTSKLGIADKWMLDELNAAAGEITANIESFDLGLASARIYDLLWSSYCDWYIEFSKPVLYGTDDNARLHTLSALVYALDKILKLLHPFAPFLTEEIYQNLPAHGKTIMLAKYPEHCKELRFPVEKKIIGEVMDLITRIRNARAEMNVPPSKRIRLNFKALTLDLSATKLYIEKLANCTITLNEVMDDGNFVSIICDCGTAQIPMDDMIDLEKEMERLQKEILETEFEIERAKSKLENPSFTAKAPEKLINAEKEKLEKYTSARDKLLERRKALNK